MAASEPGCGSRSENRKAVEQILGKFIAVRWANPILGELLGQAQF